MLEANVGPVLTEYSLNPFTILLRFIFLLFIIDWSEFFLLLFLKYCVFYVLLIIVYCYVVFCGVFYRGTI